MASLGRANCLGTRRRVGAYTGWLVLALFGCSNAPTSEKGVPNSMAGMGNSVGGDGTVIPGGVGAAGTSSPSGGNTPVGPHGGGNAGDRTEEFGGASSKGGSSSMGGHGVSGSENGGTSGGDGGTGGGSLDGGSAAGGPGAGGEGGSAGYPMLTADAIGSPVRVAGGFSLAESPLWDPCNHRLLFSDAAAGTAGVIYSVGADGMATMFMSGTGKANGMAFDADGSLLLAQMGAKHIARRDKDGKLTVLDPAGPALHTPDDLVVASDGRIYFTDGDFCPVGNLLGYGSRLPVYSFKPGDSMLVNQGVVGGPNGIELSPDEKTLYVDAYGEGAVWTFSVGADGKLTKAARAFATGLSKPDSMCVDAAGNIYVAVTSGLQVFRPDGTKVKLIPVTSLGSGCLTPGATNCGFGGEDGKTLYVTNWTTLYKVENMPIPGLDWVVNKKRIACN